MIEKWKEELLRTLPSIEKLMNENKFKKLFQLYSREFIVTVTRKTVEIIRKEVLDSKNEIINISIDRIYDLVSGELKIWEKNGIQRAVNATGVILHTNLGRAPLCKRSVNRVQHILKSYATVEMDTQTGKRGLRHRRVEELLKEITDAQGATVVNNCSAAVYLVLDALAHGRDVVISRGELVEIGGGFRIPEVIEKSGCHIVEVGTTNKTRLSDYEEAITQNTAMILKVHRSNFKITGFTEEVELEALVKLSKDRNIPLFYDQGTGLMVNLRPYGIPHELNVPESLASGADLIAFSGDKLLGGPQAGIILGKKDYIDIINKNPMMRVLRLDKMTLACLEATLEEYMTEGHIPVLDMIKTEREDLRKKAVKIFQEFSSLKGVEIIEIFSEVGGGTLPGVNLPGFAISIKTGDLNILQEKFRRHNPPIYTRIWEEQLVLDLRTISDEDINDLVACMKKVLIGGN